MSNIPWRRIFATIYFMERLNKILAHAGVGSRRHCEELITGGRVTVNDEPVRDLGTAPIPPSNESASMGSRFILSTLSTGLSTSPAVTFAPTTIPPAAHS